MLLLLAAISPELRGAACVDALNLCCTVQQHSSLAKQVTRSQTSDYVTRSL